MRRNILQGIGLFGLSKTLPLNETELLAGGGIKDNPETSARVFYKSENYEFSFS